MTKKYFFAHDGQVFRSIEELAEGIKKLSENTFAYHVNKERNDFATWVRNVFDEDELAAQLLNTTSREEIVRILENRKLHDQSNPETSSVLHKFKFLLKKTDTGKISTLIHAFELRYNQLRQSVKELERCGYDTTICQEYLREIPKLIKKFKESESESDGIDALHLFYCLENEVNRQENQLVTISKAFEQEYEEYKSIIEKEKNSGKNTKYCEMYLQRIREMINQFKETTLEKDSIETLHLLYRLQDEMRSLGTN